MKEHELDSAIYRDITDTINKTSFEVYVTESYRPVVHWYYLQHPEVPMIGRENTNVLDESENWCWSRLPLSYIVDMLVTNQPFRWKYAADIRKADMFIQTYVAQFDGIDLKGDPELQQLVNKFRTAHEKFSERVREQDANKPKPEKPNGIVDILRALGPMAL